MLLRVTLLLVLVLSLLLSPSTHASTCPTMSSPLSLHVTLVYDFTCPYCWAGKRKAEAALRSWTSSATTSATAVDAEWTWFPYKLQTDLPDEGVPKAAFLMRKLGVPDERTFDAIVARLVELGREVGIQRFAYGEGTMLGHSLDAHRLMQWDRVPPSKRADLAEQVFLAHNDRGESISKREVLVECVERAGVPNVTAADVLAFLEGDLKAGRAAILKQMDAARSTFPNINGVPHFVLDFRDTKTEKPLFQGVVSGSQDVATFKNALDRFSARAELKRKEMGL